MGPRYGLMPDLDWKMEDDLCLVKERRPSMGMKLQEKKEGCLIHPMVTASNPIGVEG